MSLAKPIGSLLSLGVLLVAAACGGGTPSTATAPSPTQGAPATPAAAPAPSGSITVYSGRNEALIGPLLERFQQESGIEVNIRYGGTTELAATLLEEGSRSPADVYIAQDGGALGAVENAGLFAELDADILERVSPIYRSAAGRWIGLSGRARVLVYNAELTDPATLPDSIMDLTSPEWDGKVGWAPTNGSLQSFVTALRVQQGDDAAKAWLEGMKANNAVEFPNNGSQVQAVSRGEVVVGLVNHYYAFQLAKQDPSLSAKNHYTAPGDIGSLVNVAGVGLLNSSSNPEAAKALIAFLVSDEAQTYFVEETFEYPVVSTVQASADLASIEEIQPPDIDLNDLEDLQGTVRLMRESGALP